MERYGWRKDCEQISVVLEVQGSEEQRNAVRRMMEDALWLVQRAGAEVRGSIMSQNGEGMRCTRIDC